MSFKRKKKFENKKIMKVIKGKYEICLLTIDKKDIGGSLGSLQIIKKLKSINKLLELIRVSETSTYNVNIQKSIAFSYTSNRLKIPKISFAMATKPIRYPEMHLTEDA